MDNINASHPLILYDQYHHRLLSKCILSINKLKIKFYTEKKLTYHELIKTVVRYYMATILKVKIKAHLLLTGRAVVFCCAHNDVLAVGGNSILLRVGSFLFLYVRMYNNFEIIAHVQFTFYFMHRIFCIGNNNSILNK